MSLILFLIIIAVFFAGIIAAIYLLLKKFSREPKNNDQAMLMLQNQIQDLRKNLDIRLGESTKMIQYHSTESQKVIRDITEKVTRKLAEVGEGQKQVFDIAKQLDNLQDILKNPKQRGVLGEYYLKTVLENVLPPNVFQMQYKFKDGATVDAAIFIKDYIIPIDSKFSLENYNRLISSKNEEEKKKLENALGEDLKQRIDETAKDIRTDEETMDFAFMFIPSEALYYDLLIHKVGSINSRDLIEYATREKKVIIVSPTSFFAYLQTVLQGLRAFQIEKSAKEIIKDVEKLGKHLISFDGYMKKVGVHLATTVNTYNTASRELGKIDKDVLKITGEALDIEPVAIDKPKEE